MDGGMSNISQILDRLQTLATQSASASFTGDRTTLNNEFQTDIQEINRQAQAIGLNVGGTFASDLAVYLGGGSGLSSGATLTNGTVSVNLSNSTVDAQSLGLSSIQRDECECHSDQREQHRNDSRYDGVQLQRSWFRIDC